MPAPITPSVPSRIRGARLAVAATFFAHGLLFASWAAHIPQLKAKLGASDGTLGFALLGTPLGAVSAIAAAVYVVPKFGSRRVVQVALVGYCASGPFVGLLGSASGVFLALFVWGAFQGTLDIAMNTQAIAVEHAARRPLMNGMHACWSVGAFVGAGSGAVGVALGVSLADQLVLLGAVALGVVGLGTRRLLLDPPDAQRHPDQPRTQRRVSPAMLLLGTIAFASMLCEGAAADWSSVYLHDSVHSSSSVSGLGYAAFALSMVLVRAFGDRLLARRSAQVLLPTLAAVTSVGFALALIVGATATGIGGFLLLGAGVGAVVPTAFSAAGRLPGVHPGVGVAAVSGLGWAGFVCGPPLIGQLAQASSLPIALGVIPVLTAAIAVATRRAVVLRNPRSREHTDGLQGRPR